MNTKANMAAIGLIGAGMGLFWPSITAPTIMHDPHYCIAAHSDTGCAAHAACTCAALEDNSTLVVLDAGAVMLPAPVSSPPACPDSDLSYGPAGPVDPPNDNCKPRVPHDPARKQRARGALAPHKARRAK